MLIIINALAIDCVGASAVYVCTVSRISVFIDPLPRVSQRATLTDQTDRNQAEMRRSPRKRPKRMPLAVIEHSQFEIVPGARAYTVSGALTINGVDELALRIIPIGARIPREEKGFKFVSVETWFSYPDLQKYYGPSNITHILKFNGLVNDLVSPDAACRRKY